ncbi:MAG TPA: GAF domain-containing protein [Kofleriaceae bacterium]|nr:GAF domain-containing protein [Kofleriaceae bacterium]
MSRVLAEETSIERAMPRILGALGTALGCALASYWIPDREELSLGATWATGDHAVRWSDESKKQRLGLGQGLPGRVWRERRPAWVADMATDSDLPRRAVLQDVGVQSGFAFPVVSGAEVLGIIDLFTCAPEPPDDHLVEVLRTIGGHLGQFIAAAHAHEQLRREAEQSKQTARQLEVERETLAKLNEIGRRLAGELDQQALVQAVTDVATELTGAQFGAFFYNVTDERGDSYMLYTISGAPREAFAKFPMPRNTQVFAPTFQGKGPIMLDDVTRDPRYGKNPPHNGMPAGHLPVRSYLAVPVLTRDGRPIGGLFFGHEKPAMFNDRAQRLAVGLATNAGIAMDNARLFADAQRLIKELEKTNTELDQFAYAASHDLRAPLRGISNLAMWIEEDLGPATPKKVREHIALLKGRAARMDKLINGLLELARVGRTRQRPERVDVTELLHETIDLLSPPEASRVLIIGAMPTLVAERFALQQVFLNLIANAIQHAGRKDVVVRISADERADEVEFTVADNGVGIPVEHHDRVWQIFQTLQARDIVESTGIGLAIVKKQVEANGGRAWIDPHTTGATMRFTWPKKLTKHP